MLSKFWLYCAHLTIEWITDIWHRFHYVLNLANEWIIVTFDFSLSSRRIQIILIQHICEGIRLVWNKGGERVIENTLVHMKIFGEYSRNKTCGSLPLVTHFYIDQKINNINTFTRIIARMHDSDKWFSFNMGEWIHLKVFVYFVGREIKKDEIKV